MPPENENSQEKLLRFKRDYERDKTTCAAWRTAARRVEDYILGDQAPANAKARGVFYVVINLLVHRLFTVLGIITAGDPRVNVTGRDVDDDDAARGVRDLMEYGAEEDHLPFLTGEASRDMVSVGLGVLEDHFDLDETRWTEEHGEVPGRIVTTKEDPLSYVFPAHTDIRMEGPKGPQRYEKETYFDRDELAMRYPDFRVEIMKTPAHADSRDIGNTGPGVYSPAGGSLEPLPDDQILFVERWYRKAEAAKVTMKVGTNPDGTPGRWTLVKDEERKAGEGAVPTGRQVGDVGPLAANPLPEGLEEQAEAEQYEIQTLNRVKRTMWHAAWVGDALLYDEPSKYKHNRWPAIFFPGLTLRRGEGIPRGKIEQMIAPQDIFNSNFSLQEDHAQRASLPLRLLDIQKILASEREGFVAKMNQPGAIGIVEPGALEQHVNSIIQEFKPDANLDALGVINRLILVMLDEVAGLTAIQKGGLPYDMSGEAIKAALQASDVSLKPYQKRIVFGLTNYARVHLSNMQQFMTVTDSWRISDDVRGAYRLALEYGAENDKEQLGLAMYPQGKPGGKPPEAKMLIPNLAVAKFDVKMSVRSGTDDRNPEERRKQAEALFGSGAVDAQYLLQEAGVEDWREVLRRTEERNEKLQTGQALEDLAKEKHPAAALIGALLSNPDIAAAEGGSGELLAMIMQDPQAGRMIMALLEQNGIPLGAQPEGNGRPALSAVPAQAGGTPQMAQAAPPGIA